MISQRVIAAPARLSAYGIYVPERILTNADFERMVETSDEWIVKRTGIRTRHVVGETEYSSDLAIGAVNDLLAHYPNVQLGDVDYIIAASTTPDYVYPSIAAMLQDHYGLPTSIGAVDISTACAGFAYGVNVACGLIASGECDRVLVVAADALTRSVDYTDRSTCVLFGDGAGVTLVERSAVPAIVGMTHGSDGGGGKFLYRTNVRTSINGVDDPARLLRQEGREVYRWAIENVPPAVERVLQRSGVTLNEIDWFVPHSANLRMIEAICKRIGFPLDRTLRSVEEFGNTSAVTIPLALIPAIRSGRVKPGDRALLMGFGGGLVLAGSVVTI
jgi:3-oxoacyl-[acyl-carrier-protein] synthase III